MIIATRLAALAGFLSSIYFSSPVIHCGSLSDRRSAAGLKGTLALDEMVSSINDGRGAEAAASGSGSEIGRTKTDDGTFYCPDENVRRAAAFAPAPLLPPLGGESMIGRIDDRPDEKLAWKIKLLSQPVSAMAVW